VMFGCFVVMVGRMFMMFCGLPMMLSCFLRHEVRSLVIGFLHDVSRVERTSVSTTTSVTNKVFKQRRQGVRKTAPNAMSALGRDEPVSAMSALPPLADISRTSRDVRFVPIADISRTSRHVRFVPGADTTRI
jgi:hypothetical protein